MKVLISMRVVENATYPERRDALSQEWGAFFSAVDPDIALIPVPNCQSVATALIRQIPGDALVLTGGNDWGAAPERDETERLLFEEAIRRGVPILGVCRGLQSINILLGGSVIPINQVPGTSSHVATTHNIAITSKRIERILRSPREVNSFHNLGVRKEGLAQELKAFAMSDDHIVEGVVHVSRPVLAMQWHPERERPFHDDDIRLIRLFLERQIS